MYFNDLHILYYVAFAIIGLIIGQIIDNLNTKLIEKKEKENEVYKIENEGKTKTVKNNYILMIINAILYVLILYKFGIKGEFINNIQLIQFLILSPFLISIICIDKKLKIIPNRLILTLFEIGIIFTFIYGIYDINMVLNRLVGMIAGAGIFFAITLIGNLISGKETIGYGDIKFIGVLGLYFGITQIMILSITSFFIGAVIGVILVIMKRKNINEDIAFGPFISISAFILMFIPFDIILQIFLKIFTLGLYKA